MATSETMTMTTAATTAAEAAADGDGEKNPNGSQQPDMAYTVQGTCNDSP
jgi:hypothetical protein